MSGFQIRQIKSRLAADFEPFIDLSDVEHHGEEQKKRFRQTRALAALVACHVGGLSPEDAAACVTDGSGDEGIDAVTTDPAGKTIYLIQAKTSPGLPKPTDISAFHDGIRQFLDGAWDEFGPKIRNRGIEFDEMVEKGADYFVAIYAYLGENPVKEDHPAQRKSERLKNEVNSNGEILGTEFWNTREIWEKRDAARTPTLTDHDILFSKWTAPFDAYKSEIVGVVSASEIHALVKAFGDRLFDKNIRKALGDSQVNEGMASTLRGRPEDFWYYNNGVTIVASEINCNSMRPKTSETFNLKNLSVVNGAQTCSTIFEVGEKDPKALEGAYVTVKVVSLADHGEDFEHQVTRFTNTQNKIGGKEFAALDSRQQEIQDALKAEGIYYSFRTGDTQGRDFAETFTLTEATQALAVANSIAHATRAKRNVGAFWSDIKTAPYTDLFNQNTDPAEVWNAVKLWRKAQTLNEEVTADLDSPRKKKIVDNALYLFATLLVRRVHTANMDLRDFSLDLDSWFEENRASFTQLLSVIVSEHEVMNPAGYPANFFKNASKVEALGSAVEKSLHS